MGREPERFGVRTPLTIGEGPEAATYLGGRPPALARPVLREDLTYFLTVPLFPGRGERKLGTICIYQATSEDKRREHADCAKLPVDEILAVGDIVIARADP